MKLLLVISEDWYFCSHRMPIAVEAIKQGWSVHLGCQVAACRDEIEKTGIALHHVPLRRGSINPLFDLGYLWRLVRLYKHEKPDVVHHVAMKPCLYGSLAAWLCRVPRVVNALAGMGFLLSSSSFAVRVIRWPVLWLFRILFNRQNSTLILQNPDDIAMFTTQVGVSPTRIHLIRGSGVNLDEFQTADHRLQTADNETEDGNWKLETGNWKLENTAIPHSFPCAMPSALCAPQSPPATAVPSRPPVQIPQSPPESSVCSLQSAVSPPAFVMVSRLLRDKGVLEFIDAARLLHERGTNCRLVLVGDADTLNPNAVDETTILAAQQNGWIDWLGRRKDIPEIYRAADAAILPSYREGMPKSLIEAAASGLPIITTDTPGCRETVRFENLGNAKLRDSENGKTKAGGQWTTAMECGEFSPLSTAGVLTPSPPEPEQIHAHSTTETSTSQGIESGENSPHSKSKIGANGILIPPRDAVALADTIEWLALHPAERSRMGLASRKLAEQEFSIETVVQKTLAIYQESQV